MDVSVHQGASVSRCRCVRGMDAAAERFSAVLREQPFSERWKPIAICVLGGVGYVMGIVVDC